MTRPLAPPRASPVAAGGDGGDRSWRLRAAVVAEQLSGTLAQPRPVIFAGGDGADSRRWWGQSLSRGAAGVAVLHGVRAVDGAGGHDRAHTWLRHAVAENISAASSRGLWFGAPAVAFAVHLAGHGRYPVAAATLHSGVEVLVRRRLAAAADRIAAHVRPSLSEFDLVRGMTGLGAYLLVREPDGVLLRGVLGYLVRLTEPVSALDRAGCDVPGWWTLKPPGRAEVDQPAEAEGGHADLGMAHGISGPLALLAITLRRGITVAGHREAIERICAWLDQWRQPAGSGTAGTWWPRRVTLSELRRGLSTQPGPGRPSWCYGTPGMARAQQLAGLALGDTTRQDTAEKALWAAVTDPAQLSHLSDLGLCHGWAGVVATVCRAAQDARHPDLARQLPRLVDHLLAATGATAVGVPYGLITGTAGAALTLHTVATGATGTTGGEWGSCLLLS